MSPESDTARFSEDFQYRYLLTREFDGSSTCIFVMLNPSTADAEQDDPTIKRCVGFAQREGFGRLEIVNLYGFMATEPKTLFTAVDPVGSDNDVELVRALSRADVVIVAWGNHGAFSKARTDAVLALITDSGKPVMCFGLTTKGQPKHPLYLPADAELMPFVRVTRLSD